MLASLLLLTDAAHAQSGPEPVGFWRFEKDVKSEVEVIAVGAAKRLDGAEFFFSDEVPGYSIYDPLRRLPYPDNASLNFQFKEGRDDALEIPLNAVQAGLSAGESVPRGAVRCRAWLGDFGFIVWG